MLELRRHIAFLVLIFSAIFYSVCLHAAGPTVVNTESISANSADNWLSYGKDYKEQRYSELDQINVDNVSDLNLAWSFDTDFNRGLEATPVVIDGVLYLTGNWSVVYALDAKSGKLLWKYDPKVPREWGKMACCDVVNRGVAAYEGKIIFGTLDARLIALDAATGERIWEVLTADTSVYPYTITGAPRVAKGKVFIGNGGAEYGVRGYVSAYDVNTGEQQWRFYTVPANPADGFENQAMEAAAKTWTGEWWNYGGGGTVWDAIVYDDELDQLYIGVGNGSPWNAKVRSPDGGDNLYLSSIVALNPDNGDYLWHYQETPAESWDYTATQHIMLADMAFDGQERKVIWHAPKNGFFFVIDRTNGELLSAEPYSDVNWASHYDLETGRPVETKNARYLTKAQMIRPSSMGAHNWQAMAYSPQTGLVYIPAINSLFEYKSVKNYLHEWGQWNLGVYTQQQSVSDPILAQLLTSKITQGALLAWDPVKQEAAWEVPHKLTWNGGLLATAGGLVFQGAADGDVLAFRADNGEKLWSFNANTGVMAPPVTYTVNGEQYITILAGWGGAFGLIAGLEREVAPPPSRVLTFKLGGSALALPANPLKKIHEPPVRISSDQNILEEGRSLYYAYCSACHGTEVISNGAIPDLRHLPTAFHDNFNAIVLDGVMKKAGMVGFSDVLTEEQAFAIHAYILEQANIDRERRAQSSWWVAIKTWFFKIVAAVLGFAMTFV
ncbi:Quinohemoprotein alcohol dehydrogenase ADH-IIG [Zhongshania aliphaticivorans]|uniref:Quinohemoprotein alcohol dehydrogenase ADH-IIG n=1 Tax=Zhongshania aliphaticivorans TaxID=1470434 RepID=A0A5S9NCV2_9GAMM|nr:PQQ-dependent dehydrogenase, methanol/ethanol family [Zhongshania aliphaticivorans]CAA0087093.1 Quinohemoprotein alcohol dehydrogenase ADH-IIG [Zhongshania aliphaticivorans]CAA0114046.1 Quinohemoprotein alcohol dehydrogenase ADH-IIG [Zhongshania aliphaticivorans]